MVELLVVLAILIALASLLLPALNMARERAKNVVCVSNLRQLYLAHLNDAVDRNGQYLTYTSTNHWVDILRPYTGSNPNLLMCPMAAQVETGTAAGAPDVGDAIFGGRRNAWFEGRSAGPYPGISTPTAGSYGLNACVSFADSSWNWSYVPQALYFNRTTEVDGKVPVFLDSMWTAGWWGANYAGTDSAVPAQEYSPFYYANGWSIQRFAVRRHFNTSDNVAFADGHVASVKLPDLWTLRGSANWVQTSPAVIPWY